MNHLKRHLSVANVLSCLALFMALSGVAYAATLGKNAVKTKNIANGAVTSPKIKNGGVTAAKLANGAVIGSKLANGAVSSTKIANGAVRSAALGGGIVTTAKLKNGAVDESKLAAGAVSTGKLQEGAVSGSKLSSSLLALIAKNVSYVTKTSESNTDAGKSITAECPTGKQVTGGGARIVGSTTTVAITESAPTVNIDGKRTGWAASARAIAVEGNSWAVEAYAVCAEF